MEERKQKTKEICPREDRLEVGYVRGMKYLGHTFYKTGEG